jgi:5-methylcytosine-specific restriction endonuclease McrA
VVDCTGLENRRRRKSTVGSNPTLSAKLALIAQLVEQRGYSCECCGISEWQGKPIVLECDHIDGNHKNNTPENLRLICPNCHSQTETYKNKNIGKGRSYR